MFLHSVAVQDQAISADGIETFDLAVNPLSHLLICLRPLNDTGTLGNFQTYLGIAGAINRMQILFRGESIVAMSGRDAAALAWFRNGIYPFQEGNLNTNNFRRVVPLPVLMGRFPYDKTSCFPASKRGELVLELDFDIADTGYDGLRLTVEQVELLDAKPKEYERKVTTTQTLAATGDNDIDLTPGNDVRGILMFGTTAFTGASPAPTLGRLSTLLDNQQMGYASTDFEVAHTIPALWGRQPALDHIHAENDTGGPTDQPNSFGLNGWQNYAFLDFDTTRDDEFTVKTAGKSRFQVRTNAEAAELIRAIPIEVIKV